MRPYLPCVLGTSPGHETENRRKPNHNRQIVIPALWKSSHPVTLPTRINSTSEPLPKRLYSAKISRALLGLFSAYRPEGDVRFKPKVGEASPLQSRANRYGSPTLQCAERLSQLLWVRTPGLLTSLNRSALWLARFSGSPLSCPLGCFFYSLVSVREVMRRANRSLLWRRRITKVLLSPYIAHGPGGTSRNSANFQSHASLLPRPR